MSTEAPTFSTAQVASLLEIAPYDLRYWVKSGLLSASVQGQNGKGNYLAFSLEDLRMAFFIRRLNQAGVKPKLIKGILSEVHRVVGDPSTLVTPILIPFGTTLLILHSAACGIPMLYNASRPGQYVMAIALETLDEDVRQGLARSK